MSWQDQRSLFDRCMDRWMHGWLDGCLHGCMDACMVRWMHAWMDAWMEGCMHEWMHGWKSSWTDEWMNDRGWIIPRASFWAQMRPGAPYKFVEWVNRHFFKLGVFKGGKKLDFQLVWKKPKAFKTLDLHLTLTLVMRERYTQTSSHCPCWAPNRHLYLPHLNGQVKQLGKAAWHERVWMVLRKATPPILSVLAAGPLSLFSRESVDSSWSLTTTWRKLIFFDIQWG